VFVGDFFGPAGVPLLIEATGRQAGVAGGPTLHTAACSVVGAGHTTVRCISPPGVGTGYAWSLSVAGQTSAPSAQTTSYGPPSVTELTVAGTGIAGGDEPGSVPTAGGATVTLTGMNFGPDGALIVVTWNGVVVPNVALSVPHSSLSFTSLPGQGTAADVSLTVGAQSSKSVVRVPFAAPRVTSLRLDATIDTAASLDCRDVGADGRSTAGSDPRQQRAVIVIRGVNFGRGNATVVTVGDDPCIMRAPVEDTVIVCQTSMCTGSVARLLCGWSRLSSCSSVVACSV
jgi:hypothetical protein